MLFRPGFSAQSQTSHVIFDFDGTLSWLRHGWPELMLGLFLEHVPAGSKKMAPGLPESLLDDIISLNGKPSIHQMRLGARRIREHGGSAPAPEELLSEYQRRLDALILERTASIRNGQNTPDDFVVYRARELLNQLRERGLKLVILSGTLERRVKEEAELLKLAEYFGGRIYGGSVDIAQFDKQIVIERLLRDERLRGENLLSFGDGPVEIRVTKSVGGMGVGVASDENHNGSGKMDSHKERQLWEAGADALVPDYRDGENLLRSLLAR